MITVPFPVGRVQQEKENEKARIEQCKQEKFEISIWIIYYTTRASIIVLFYILEITYKSKDTNNT